MAYRPKNILINNSKDRGKNSGQWSMINFKQEEKTLREKNMNPPNESVRCTLKSN